MNELRLRHLIGEPHGWIVRISASKLNLVLIGASGILRRAGSGKQPPSTIRTRLWHIGFFCLQGWAIGVMQGHAANFDKNCHKFADNRWTLVRRFHQTQQLACVRTTSSELRGAVTRLPSPTPPFSRSGSNEAVAPRLLTTGFQRSKRAFLTFFAPFSLFPIR